MNNIVERAGDTGAVASAKLEVVVIHTGTKRTLAALRAAGRLARGLNASLHLIVPHIVPYPAPLEQPPVRASFMERRFRTMAEEVAVDTKVDVWLCRDWETILPERLKTSSVIVIGAGPRRWWWPSKEHRLAAALERQGHHVVLA
jgi:K+-sensing histidine kinase KdpD